MMTKLMTATALGLIVTAAAALAQTAPPAPQARVMTRGEVQTKVREHFGRMDANKDGAVTTIEISQLHPRMGKHRMGHGGPDGVMKHGGPMRDPAAAFDRLDSDKNGMISRDEFAKGREIRIEKRIAMRDGSTAGARTGERHKMGMRHRRGGGMAGGRMIVMADSNKDGRITLAEAEAMALQRFDRIDANRDGQVTPEERRAGRAMRMKMLHAPKAT